MTQVLPRRNLNLSVQVDASSHSRFRLLVFSKDLAQVLYRMTSTELFDEFSSHLLVAFTLFYHQFLHATLVHLHT